MTLFNSLETHHQNQPNAVAYTFIDENDASVERTFTQIYRRVTRLAALLQQLAQPGERVILMYQPSIDFIEAILACFAAGVVAVPIQPLQNKRVISRIQNIKRDAAAKIILTNQQSRSTILRIVPQADSLLDNSLWIESDFVAHSSSLNFQQRPVNEDAIAFLQYTSGSTGTPKGAIVSHANLMHNMSTIKSGFGHDHNTVFTGWLPLYHDMGLVGNVFQPLYLGIPCVLFSPMTFLKSPIKWLSAISKFGATTSGAPNFAYELCVNRVTEQEMEGIDLSSWKVAYNGAEPVKADVIAQFSKKFQPYGFSPEAFYPCYGMAETTLFVSGSKPGKAVVNLAVNPLKLAQNIIEEQAGSALVLVGCGQVYGDQKVIIVNPDTREKLNDEHIGELWIRGGSITQGYWNLPELTESAFKATTIDGDGPWFRTGDLGFWRDHELFITGRIKDLLIIRGQNHYPTDIESTIYSDQDYIRAGCVAVVSSESEAADESRLVVIAELNRQYISGYDQALFDHILAGARKAVSEAHGLRLHDLVLIRPQTIAKTSSGKIRRSQCKALYESRQLSPVAIKASKKETAAEVIEG